MSLEDMVAEIMDNFIKSTGGNLDHRGNNDGDRRALRSFLEQCLTILPPGVVGRMALLNAAQSVLDKRLPQVTCQTKEPVYTKV